MSELAESHGTGLTRFLTTVRRRWPVIAGTVVLAVAGSLLFSSQQQPQYAAEAQLLLRDAGFDQKLFGDSAIATPADPTRAAATNSGLVSLDTISRLTSRALGGSPTPDDVKRKVSVKPQGQSDLVAVTASDPKPTFAAELANEYARQFVAFRRDADQATLRLGYQLVQRQLDALTPSERISAAGRDLRARGEELQLLESLQTGNAEQVQTALPPATPASPRTVRNAVFAALLGALLGLALALGYERIDRRLRDGDEVAQLLGRPLLAVVPEHRDLGAGSATTRGPRVSSEAFGMLRANLRYFNMGSEIGSVVVTSAEAEEGKTTVAMHLARAAAAAGDDVLLVETDLRRPTLATRLHDLGGAVALGTSTVLSGQCELTEAIVEISLESDHDAHPNSRTFSVLPAGPIPPNPTDLMEGPGLVRLFDSATDAFDLVIFDTPPIPIVPDAIPLLRLVSGVVVVARLRKTHRDVFRRFKEQLGHLDANVLGVVVNGADTGSGYYQYGYSTTPAKTPASRA